MMNEEFLQRIKSYIPNEYDQFLAAMDQQLYKGVRINALKADPQATAAALGLDQPSIFAPDAWYTTQSWGLHPLHMAGVLYMQEPSASAAVGLLELQPTDYVLDLCAAPGSKSTQILPFIPDGYLLSNEYEARRAQILLSNLERMGAVNFAVTNMDTNQLCRQFIGCFDKVLVDAPCSGEGMMKKHEAAQDWSLNHVLQCAGLQHEILANAALALKPGGILVYSTCTYAKEENEEQVSRFLAEHPEMELLTIEANFGRPGLETPGLEATKVRRIFPMDGGEGHFLAKMRKTSGTAGKLSVKKSAQLPETAQKFLKEQTDQAFAFYDLAKGKDKVQVFGMNVPFLKFKAGKVLRQGVLLGEEVKKRFEPAHAFYLNAAMAHHFKQLVNLDAAQADDFAHGLTLDLPLQRGYTAVAYEDQVFGFGKSDGRQLKNKYPKGLRLLPNSHVLLSPAETPKKP